MSETFGLHPDYFLDGPYMRWERYRRYIDDKLKHQKEAARRGAR